MMVFTKNSLASGPQWFSQWTDYAPGSTPRNYKAGTSTAANERQQSSWTDNSKSASFSWLTNVVRVTGDCCSVVECRSHSSGYTSWHLLNIVFPGIGISKWSTNICWLTTRSMTCVHFKYTFLKKEIPWKTQLRYKLHGCPVNTAIEQSGKGVPGG